MTAVLNQVEEFIQGVGVKTQLIHVNKGDPGRVKITISSEGIIEYAQER